MKSAIEGREGTNVDEATTRVAIEELTSTSPPMVMAQPCQSPSNSSFSGVSSPSNSTPSLSSSSAGTPSSSSSFCSASSDTLDFDEPLFSTSGATAAVAAVDSDEDEECVEDDPGAMGSCLPSIHVVP